MFVSTGTRIEYIGFTTTATGFLILFIQYMYVSNFFSIKNISSNNAHEVRVYIIIMYEPYINMYLTSIGNLT